ncbi:MAG: YggS family pyridoxal phosphate-dependent enzyme [Thermotoga sp.]|nr:YggS family pyridoxal phosphate-dependent enzyme [Thermotogota bacterium]RKX56065.1 MAG: YggS family pyridoxal phosphate-dependent enzyme [Thermotoga sp.]
MMDNSTIEKNVKRILSELPSNVKLVAAAKTRNAEEIERAIRAGVKIIGENYIQEAESVYPLVREKASWHFIGHLQKNKVKKAVNLFDMIETIDSFKIAVEIDKRCARLSKTMDVLVEVNSGKEPQKSGVIPEEVEQLVKQISSLEHIRIMGLMTMGPRFGNPEDSRPYFKLTKKIFDRISILNIPNVEMRYLSMGMSNSYKVAIEEGTNLVRIGTKIFGERVYEK